MNLAAGIVFGGVESAEVDGAIADDSAGLHFRCQAAYEPRGFAGIEGVRIGAKRARCDDLGRATFGAVHDGRGMATQCFGPLPLPTHMAIVLCNGDDERTCRLIADQHDFIVCHDGRCTHAVDIAERTERQAPTLVTVEAVGDQSEIAEEYVDVSAVGRGAGRSGSVQLVERFGAAAGTLAPPQDLSGLAAQAERVEFAVVDGRQENAITAEYGRRMTGRQRRFPNDIAAGTKDLRHCGGIRDSGTVRSAETGPVAGSSAGGES